MLKICFLINLCCALFIIIEAPKSSENQALLSLNEGIISFYSCQIQSSEEYFAKKSGISVENVPNQPLTDNNVTFSMYTRNDPKPQLIDFDALKNVCNYTCQIIIYVHGIELHDTTETEEILSVMFPKHDVILIVLNYDSYAFFERSYTRKYIMPELGIVIRDFTTTLINRGGINPKNIYYNCYSTPCQAVALAAKQIKPRIGRILAIDPAGTCYNFLPVSQKLNKDDAEFVEIVHCSVGNYGSFPSYHGDATFYLNGGIIQPSCRQEPNITAVGHCSHAKCKEYFLRSIAQENKYIGINCDSYQHYLNNRCNYSNTAQMGFGTPSNTRGLYFVDT